MDSPERAVAGRPQNRCRDLRPHHRRGTCQGETSRGCSAVCGLRKIGPTDARFDPLAAVRGIPYCARLPEDSERRQLKSLVSFNRRFLRRTILLITNLQERVVILRSALSALHRISTKSPCKRFS